MTAANPDTHVAPDAKDGEAGAFPYEFVGKEVDGICIVDADQCPFTDPGEQCPGKNPVCPKTYDDVFAAPCSGYDDFAGTCSDGHLVYMIGGVYESGVFPYWSCFYDGTTHALMGQRHCDDSSLGCSGQVCIETPGTPGTCSQFTHVVKLSCPPRKDGGTDVGDGGDGGDAPVSDGPVDGGPCPRGEVLRYVTPGCGLDAHPTCGPALQDACSSPVCGCDGTTISKCDFADQPYRYVGACLGADGAVGGASEAPSDGASGG